MQGVEAVPAIQPAHDLYGPSVLRRRQLCAGSAVQERLAHEQGLAVEASPEAAADGILCHERTDPGTPLNDLTDEQRRAVLAARAFEADFFAGARAVYREKHAVLWAKGPVPATHGTMDSVGIFPRMVKVIDWKFGRGTLFAETIELQAACYAGAAMQEFGKPKAEVAIYQPREGYLYTGAYSRPAQIAARVMRIREAAECFPADLTPSLEACRYCHAKTICPDFRQEIMTSVPATREAIEVLRPEQLARALEFASLLEPWAKAVREHARTLVENGVEIPGWTLRERNMRSAPRLMDLRNAVLGVLTGEDFASCCEVSVRELEDTYARRLKETDGLTLKEAKARFAEATASAVQVEVQRYLKRKECDDGQ